MSRLVEIPEILLEIFELVFITDEGYADLATLARTCRTFYKPAISFLWHTQQSLLPLIMCFPPEILDISRDPDEGVLQVKFTNSPSPRDWERPLIYTKLIKAIKRNRESQPAFRVEEARELHISVLKTLFDTSPILPLLPGLQEIDYHWLFRLSHWCEVHAKAKDVSAYLSKLSSQVLLRSLKFKFQQRPCIYSGDALVAEVIEHFPCIESIDIHNGDDAEDISEFFPPIGSLQNLTSLTLTHHYPSEPDLLPSFPAILDIDLFCSSSFILRILKAIQSPKLRQISLRVFFQVEPDDLDKICTFVTSRDEWQRSMRSMAIVGMLVSLRTVETLFVFRSLCHVHFWIQFLDDNDRKKLSDAWPMLDCVSNVDVREPHVHQASYCSVLLFARRCPHLGHLELPENDRIPRQYDESGTSSAFGSQNRLLLDMSPSFKIRDSTAVAEFISDMHEIHQMWVF